MMRLLFLGDRRIAWDVLTFLHRSATGRAFDLRGLVSCPSMVSPYNQLRGDEDYRFISNAARANDAIHGLIEQERIDLLLSVQYNWVLPPSILDAVQRRAFNLHNAKLPEYKGYNSVSQAIMNGDTVYESTLHWMDDQVDAGDIAYIGTTPIAPDDHAYGLYERSVPAAVGVCTQLLTTLAHGHVPPRQPMRAGAGHFYPRDSVQRIADVTGMPDNAERARIVRAAFFPPFNTAYQHENGQKKLLLPPGVDAATMPWPAANRPDYALNA